jgi:hypothetical protein
MRLRNAKPREAPLAAALLAILGCALEERADFLVGRACTPESARCDPGQVCLPHAFEGGVPGDFRCRDAASFRAPPGREAPLAFCGPDEGLVCPEGMVCGAGRIRRDAGPRRPVCRFPGAAFGPPPERDGG